METSGKIKAAGCVINCGVTEAGRSGTGEVKLFSFQMMTDIAHNGRIPQKSAKLPPPNKPALHSLICQRERSLRDNLIVFSFLMRGGGVYV